MDNNYESALRFRMDEQKVSDVISMGSCSDTVSCSMVEIQPEAQGRMVEIGVRVRKVCPGKRVALGLLLHELDENDAEHVRGMKAMTLPAHHEASCRDIVVEGVRFVLPEDVSLSNTGSCGERRFRVRTHVHYMDANDVCGCT